MKLGRKGHYAVMAMVDLALHNHYSPVALSVIAKRQQIPVQYLEQLFSKLRRVGLVKSTRGAKGGYTLAKPSNQIAVAEVIVAVDEVIETTRCHRNSTLGCQGKHTKCLTHALWAGVGEYISHYLERVTLEHICQKTIPKIERLPV